MTKFEIIDHEHDVVVVGARGAGLGQRLEWLLKVLKQHV